MKTDLRMHQYLIRCFICPCSILQTESQEDRENIEWRPSGCVGAATAGHQPRGTSECWVATEGLAPSVQCQRQQHCSQAWWDTAPSLFTWVFFSLFQSVHQPVWLILQRRLVSTRVPDKESQICVCVCVCVVLWKIGFQSLYPLEFFEEAENTL